MDPGKRQFASEATAETAVAVRDSGAALSWKRARNGRRATSVQIDPAMNPPHIEHSEVPRPELERLLSTRDLAGYLGVGRRTVYTLPIPYSVVGSCRRFRRADVEAYLARGRNVP